MNKNPVNGMRDILPKEAALRSYVLETIRKTYRAFGFTEIETPVVESIENLTGKNGGENEKLTFQILKRGEKLKVDEAKNALDLADSGLRYDLTMPLTRFYACHAAELPKPFKALQIGPVFRAERPQKGRYREFYQCDIDILGDGSNLAEIELISATAKALANLGFHNVEIRLNDRALLRDAASWAGIPEEKRNEFFVILDKLDKIGREGVREELRKAEFSDTAVEAFLSIVETGKGAPTMEAIRSIGKAVYGEAGGPVTDNLLEIAASVEQAKTVPFSVVFDPTLVRGMGYYTGPIFEIQVPEFSAAVGGGGRYDELVGKFTGQNVPAAGFSIGFERIVAILIDRAFTIPGSPEKTAILLEKNLSPEKRAEALREAESMRSEGRTVLVTTMMKNKKFQKEQLALDGYETILERYENPIME